ncbi:MAG: hydrogen gas-evolving membrane-bound hydrogenase subunit E [Candidatus Thermoplasmatota archaeon]
MRKAVALIAFFVIFAFLVVGVVQMRPFGEPENEEMDDHFLGDSQQRHQVNNVVTAVLFDYRGLDTLGEATILFSAVSGVLTVLRKVKDEKEGVED